MPATSTSAVGRTFHSAQWDHEHDLAGRRVAVVGTGASAIQFVPKIQPRGEQLTLFQRTPPWIMPHAGRPVRPRERALFRQIPALQRLVRGAVYWGREVYVLPFVHPALSGIPERMARRHLGSQVPDERLRARLTPDYAIGCKRTLIANDYYPALCQSNVGVVTSGIRRVEPHAVVTEDGVTHEVDTIVFGTGFHVSDMPIGELVRGRDGRTLAEVWDGRPQALRGTTVCASWYLDRTGRNTTLWPGKSWRFRTATRHFDENEYDLRPRVGAHSHAAAAVAG